MNVCDFACCRNQICLCIIIKYQKVLNLFPSFKSQHSALKSWISPRFTNRWQIQGRTHVKYLSKVLIYHELPKQLQFDITSFTVLMSVVGSTSYIAPKCTKAFWVEILVFHVPFCMCRSIQIGLNLSWEPWVYHRVAVWGWKFLMRGKQWYDVVTWTFNTETLFHKPNRTSENSDNEQSLIQWWLYRFPFTFGGDVLGWLRRWLLLLRGRVHNDGRCLHRGGELGLGWIVGPCCGSNRENIINQHILTSSYKLTQTCLMSIDKQEKNTQAWWHTPRRFCNPNQACLRRWAKPTCERFYLLMICRKTAEVWSHYY